MIKDRISMTGDPHNTEILFDGEALFQKPRFGGWVYIHKINNQLTYESLKLFDDAYIGIFVDDIIEQLESGVDKDNLKINTPKKIENVKIGNKVVTIEI